MYCNNMKKIVFLLFVSILCFSCSQKDIENKGNQNVRKHIAQQMSSNFPLSFGEQDELVRQFAEICTNDEVNDFLLGTDGVVPYERWHALLNGVDESAQENYDQLSLILDGIGENQFREDIDNLCTSNYLNFNVYVPHYEESFFSYYYQGASIYIVNALYSDALEKIARDDTYEYKVSYVVSNGDVHPSDLMIDEEFCRNHPVYFVTFRDEIVNWNHFAKGTQSVSDWLITTAVAYQGFGCLTPAEVIEEGYGGYNALRIPILHSKKTFKKPCDEKYDHFCKFGKPKKDIELETELEALYEFDPYRTSWMVFDAESNDQYIEVKSNTLGLDLEGHDFYVYDTTLVLPDGIIRIPAQISTYAPERNAQHIEMEYIAG